MQQKPHQNPKKKNGKEQTLNMQSDDKTKNKTQNA
jgi:hypothetical protein